MEVHSFTLENFKNNVDRIKVEGKIHYNADRGEYFGLRK